MCLATYRHTSDVTADLTRHTHWLTCAYRASQSQTLTDPGEIIEMSVHVCYRMPIYLKTNEKTSCILSTSFVSYRYFIFKVNFLLAITLDFMTKCEPETTLEIKFVTPTAQNVIVCKQPMFPNNTSTHP